MGVEREAEHDIAAGRIDLVYFHGKDVVALNQMVRRYLEGPIEVRLARVSLFTAPAGMPRR
jgi:hypothetical protein